MIPNHLSRRSRNQAIRAPRAASLLVEPVEPRCMLSAAVDHAVLVVQGTRRADDITVSLNGARTINVTINGRQSTFARRTFGAIRIVAGRGDDLVTVGNPDRPISAGVLIIGGDGDDTLIGGAGDDTLRGESGNDEVAGNGGNDLLQGGGGKDRLGGNDGDDLVLGDSGADDLRGDGGNDSLCGGRGDDTLHEDEGTDRVCGNQGVDFFDFTDSPKDVRDETADETITQVVFGPTRAISTGELGSDVPVFTPIDPIRLTLPPILKDDPRLVIPPVLVNPFPPILGGIGSGGGTIHSPVGTGTGTGTGSGAGAGGGQAGSGIILIGNIGGLNPGTPITLGRSLTLGSLIFTFRVGGEDIVTHPGNPLIPPTIGGEPVTPASMPLLLARLGNVTLEGGGFTLDDGSALTVPTGTVIRLADDSVQTTVAGSVTTVTGPLSITLPSGNWLRVIAPLRLTIQSFADPVIPVDPTPPVTDGDATPPPTDVPGDPNNDPPSTPPADPGDTTPPSTDGGAGVDQSIT